jgi:hypothetical protein
MRLPFADLPMVLEIKDAHTKRAILSAIPPGEASAVNGGDARQKGRSTLTARASRTIEARGTLVSVIRPSFGQRQRRIQALSLRRRFG